MKKNTIIPLILVIFAVAALFYIGSNTDKSLFSISQGLTVLSIDQPQITSNVADLQNYNWYVTANLGGSEQITGSVSADSLSQKLPEGLEAKYGFILSAKDVTDYISYSVKRDYSSTIYQYSYEKTTESFFSLTPPDCPLKSGQSPIYNVIEENRVGAARDIRHCIYKTRVGAKGNIENPTQHFNTTINIDFENPNIQDPSPIVLSKSNPSTNIGQYAFVEFTGFKGTGAALPSYNIDNYAILKLDAQTGDPVRWHVIAKDLWTQFVAQEQLMNNYLFSNSISQLNVDGASETDVSDRINNQLNDYNLKYSTLNLDSTNTLGLNEIGGVSNDFTATYNPSNKLYYPEVRFRIRADAIGLNVMVGEPSISDLKCPIFTSGSQGFVSLDIKNVGDADATFVVEKTGCDAFKQKNLEELSVSKGQTINDYSVELEVGFINEDLIQECTITVKDKAYPINSDSSKVSCELDKEKICSPGQSLWNEVSRCVEKCSATGDAKDTVECCESNERVELAGGIYQCVAPGQEVCFNGLDDNNNDEVDENCKKSSPSVLLLIISLIIGGVATFYANPFIQRVKSKYKWVKPLLYVTIFLVATFLAAFIIKFIVNWVKDFFTISWW